MYDTTTNPTATTTVPVSDRHPDPTEFGTVAVDLYKDIHKAIRAELFSVVGEAGALDPADRLGRAELAGHVRSVVGLLRDHAEHEDAAVQPVIEDQLPNLAGPIASDHRDLDERMDVLVRIGDGAVTAPEADRRAHLHQLYLELSSFTGAYLHHQDLEERVVMPALEQAIGPDAVLGIHQAIVGSIPPAEMATSLAVMLPAMNVEDRVELLGGMRAEAPAEVFDGVWGLARSVLVRSDAAALAGRLGLVDA